MTAWDAIAARRAGVPVFAPGHVWLAGAGPGDPGLLTLDALAGLTQADVIVHDALVDKRVLALAGPQARLEFAGKRGGKPSATQADISQRLVVLARAGKRVLRLKGGDPFVFGRGGEEAMTLAAAGSTVPRHPRRHRGPRRACSRRDSGDAARRQSRRHFRRRSWRRRGVRLGRAGPHRTADRALHGDAQSGADRRRVDRGGSRRRRRRPP